MCPWGLVLVALRNLCRRDWQLAMGQKKEKCMPIIALPFTVFSFVVVLFFFCCSLLSFLAPPPWALGAPCNTGRCSKVPLKNLYVQVQSLSNTKYWILEKKCLLMSFRFYYSEFGNSEVTRNRRYKSENAVSDGRLCLNTACSCSCMLVCGKRETGREKSC